ncbi:basic leucine zipper 19-like [Amaranthus tricolor]|uniref:basic leucine zipper 19-like n=1 Tax=Amaranthus tricolor TaxID=29722 RepID=UPI00259085E7|nr:basic leucine zipper 19-like [Amaranthus tricolor]
MEEQHYYGNSSSIGSNNNNSCNSDLASIVDGQHVESSNLNSLFSRGNISDEVPWKIGGSMENIFDDLLLQDLKNDVQNGLLPRQNYAHLQNDFEIFPLADKNDEDNDHDLGQSNKRNNRVRTDNKEAVRRYREKLKAHEVSLEQEINRLKASNEELSNKLEDEATLQAEISWLKCLLVDIKGRIEGQTYYSPRPYVNDHHHRSCSGKCVDNVRPFGQSTQILYDQAPSDDQSHKINYTSVQGPQH